jgi:hypothetical protein
MKTNLLCLIRTGALIACALASGCVTTTKIQMPADWERALAHASGTPPEISGTYSNYSSKQSARLDVLLWGEELSPAPQRIQLRLLPSDRLEATALCEGTAPITKILAVEIDKNTGAVKPPAKSGFALEKGGGGWIWKEVELFKGNDGSLYGHVAKGGAIAFAYVIPVVGSGNVWRRWEPAAP